MVPSCGGPRVRIQAAPRRRRDGPYDDALQADDQACSPHTRGWSRDRSRRTDARLLLPAHAGMVPPSLIPTHRVIHGVGLTDDRRAQTVVRSGAGSAATAGVPACRAARFAWARRSARAWAASDPLWRRGLPRWGRLVVRRHLRLREGPPGQLAYRLGLPFDGLRDCRVGQAGRPASGWRACGGSRRWPTPVSLRGPLSAAAVSGRRRPGQARVRSRTRGSAGAVRPSRPPTCWRPR
ncbi:hypothetical protein QFZ76_010287 [Streptomyces sp. V4I2]|nr:hypothetical protein [Streptomyces sp. V4I2]